MLETRTLDLSGKKFVFVKTYIETLFKEDIQKSNAYFCRSYKGPNWFDLNLVFFKKKKKYNFIISYKNINDIEYQTICNIIVQNVPQHKILEGWES